MQRFPQLTADQQAAAIEQALREITNDPDMLADPSVRPRLDALARRRASDVYYLEPGDRVVQLPGPINPNPTH
jgi:hypothetical protein